MNEDINIISQTRVIIFLITNALHKLIIKQVQCNVFEGASGEIALTAAGGLRQIPGIAETFENAALVTLYSI